MEENVTIRSRWQGSGAGRSDIVIAGPDVDLALSQSGLSGPASASQCWDTRFLSVYDASTPAQLTLLGNDGQSSACVFAAAELPNL
jgi:hypothetical protein